MTDTPEAATPDAEETIQESKTTALPTLAEIQKQRDEKRAALAKGENPKPKDEPEPEETEEEPEEPEESEAEEEVVEEQEEATKEAPVLSQEYFDEQSDEDKEKILEGLKDSIGKAFGKQRKELRELKAKLEVAEAARKEVSAIADGGGLHSEEQVDQTIAQIQQNIKLYEDKLIYENETDYVGDKEVRGIKVNGEFVDVESVRKWADSQRENIKKLNDRKEEIKKISKIFDDEDVEIETLKQKLDMDETEAEAFEKSLSDPSFEVIKTVKPEYAKGLYEVFAKAAIADRKPKPRKAPKPKKESTSLPRGGNTGDQSIVSQMQKLQNIVSGKTKADIRERIDADRQLRALRKQVK